MKTLGLNNFAQWFGLAVTVCGAMWALLSFRRNNRIKAAEILISIEKDYGSHIPVLLEIEDLNTYAKKYRYALFLVLEDKLAELTEDDNKEIQKLEAVLRHFFVCANVRWLSVDAGAIDRLCAWYLRVLVTDKQLDKDGNIVDKRPELREYIRRYWPTIYFWAPLAPEPVPKRLLIIIRQLNERRKSWWSGSWAKPTEMSRFVDDSNSPKKTP